MCREFIPCNDLLKIFVKRSLNTLECGLEDKVKDLANPWLPIRWPDGQANGLQFVQYSKDLQTPGLGKICKKNKIENAKKVKKRRCFKGGDDQGGLWMLKAKAAEGLKKARELDARTEPELGNSRTTTQTLTNFTKGLFFS